MASRLESSWQTVFRVPDCYLEQLTDSQVVNKYIAALYKILVLILIQRSCFVLHTGMATSADASLRPLSATCTAPALGFRPSGKLPFEEWCLSLATKLGCRLEP